MVVDTVSLMPATPGSTQSLTVFRFGRDGARPKVYIQGALHADETPGMLTASRLVQRLRELDEAKRVTGEIVVVPVANPIGLAQTVLGNHVGRFSLADGSNFNRRFPDLSDGAAERVAARLGPDEVANTALIRQALIDTLDALPATTPVDTLKHALLRLALDSDVLLDLHCDSEAVMHLYALTPHVERCAPLACYLGAEAILLATESGDNPFDEAASRPWLGLSQRFPEWPVPIACMAVTVELRGQRDVSAEFAATDAAALVNYLVHLGAMSGETVPLPMVRCRPTPLAATEVLVAPVGGIALFHAVPGAMIAAGDTVLDILDPLTGISTPIVARSSGILFARTASGFVAAGRRLGKIAGTTPHRSGNLLSP